MVKLSSLQKELEVLENRLKHLSGFEWRKEYRLYQAVKRFKLIYPKPYFPDPVSDWYFEAGYGINWNLDTSIYRSAPSSLRCLYMYESQIVCNVLATRNLKQGRVESWFYKAGGTYERGIGFCFRLQYPTWTSRYRTYQSIIAGTGTSSLIIYKNGATLKSGDAPQPPINSWFKRRVTWWTTPTWFCIRVERWTGTDWVNDIGDALDESPLYGDSSINYCGLNIRSHSDYDIVRIDDTAIYG
jgi:hypothetical protein